MKEFTVGSVWKTRSGDQARIICVDFKGPGTTIVAAVKREKLECLAEYNRMGIHLESEFLDLVSPWPEGEPAI